MKMPSVSLPPVSPSPAPTTSENINTHPEPLDNQSGKKRLADSASPTNQPGGAMKANLIQAEKQRRALSIAPSVVDVPNSGNSQIPRLSIPAIPFVTKSTSISKLKKEVARTEIKEFRTRLKNLTSEPDHVSKERFDATQAVVDGVEKDIDQKITIFSCKVAGQPAGFLTLDHKRFPKDPPYINHLVTYPGHRGLGGALIEHAVNRSQKLGHNGVVEISPGSQKIKEIYEAIGFTKDSEFMKLTPGGNTNWSFNGKKWKLKSDSEKNIL
ncbi:GNAT family N-acetyltransferase [Herbaspirillum sp. GCM10030257]|uniref:GNAT family N-acetyltransferase n=1 Tax=Herbaspirillum sp. GCM10030257 TaxID=3273393 RepID=UPI00360E69C6